MNKVFVTLIVLIVQTSNIFGQNVYSPFKGGISASLGLSTIIDFNKSDYYIWIPKTLGAFTYKNLGPDSYFELGMFYTQRGSCQVLYDVFKRTETILINCIDFTGNFYKRVGYYRKSDIYVSGGICNEDILRVHLISDNRIPESFFRHYSFSINSGLSLQSKMSRWKLYCNLALIPIVKPEFRDQVEDYNSNFGNLIFPMELMFSYSFLIN